MNYTEADLIAFGSGKKELPVGLTKTMHGSYRIQRSINGKKYIFPVVRNLELALKLNHVLGNVQKDVSLSSEERGASVQEIDDLLCKQSSSSVEELEELKLNVKTIYSMISKVSERQQKGFFRRLFNL